MKELLKVRQFLLGSCLRCVFQWDAIEMVTLIVQVNNNRDHEFMFSAQVGCVKNHVHHV